MKSIRNIINLSEPIIITLSIYVICVVFWIAVAFNLSPFLRGPSDAQWRWPYQFINTVNMIWQPGFVMALILGLFWFSQRRLEKWGKSMLLGGLVVLAFAWQIAVLNFSRVGANYLIQRTVNPGLNGYYTAGLGIQDLGQFIRDYPNLVNTLPMHAKGHPPGGVILYHFLNLVLGPRMTALRSPVLIVFLSCLTIPLVYLISKNFRAAFFAAVIPSVSLFLPLLDVVYPLFGLIALFLAINKREFFAGVIFGLGLFFSYSILPVGVIITFLIRKRIQFLSGLLVFIGVLELLGYDFIRTTITVISNQAPRSFWVWLVFNPYDFIVFLGFPLAILAWLGVEKKWLIILLSIFLTIFSRAEVGRIWLPLMPLATISAGKFLADKKFEPRLVAFLLSLQMVQTLVIQEFWVPLW